MEEAKRRKSICSYCEEDGDEDEDSLPVLKNQSVLLENMHIEQVKLITFSSFAALILIFLSSSNLIQFQNGSWVYPGHKLV